MNYKDKLDEMFEKEKERECPPEDKLEFIGNHIFNFITYDGLIDKVFAIKMIEVLECILHKKTFEYIDASKSNYLNFLTMVNMPFLNRKLDWGGSIRGAWFDEYGHNSEIEPRTYNISITYDFSIPKKKINNFINDLIEWSKY